MRSQKAWEIKTAHQNITKILTRVYIYIYLICTFYLLAYQAGLCNIHIWQLVNVADDIHSNSTDNSLMG